MMAGVLKHYALLGIAFALLLSLTACDTGVTGAATENQHPETELSVRDSSLVDNLEGADRLSSTVFAAWSGTDPDGFVTTYELRFYPDTQPPAGPEEGWITTTSSDSLILLPIPRGERIANVVFEVRAIDNDGAVDPTPARTVFPIQNSPPTLRLSPFDQPPDTTFTVFSFAWDADDPEGVANLDRIEISLNDSTSFTPLPADAEFVTLVGEETSGDAETTTADVFLGRGFQTTGLTVPNLRLDAENTFYVRAVDQTDTTSTLQRLTWYVKPIRGDVLFVNDFRRETNTTLVNYHLGLLREYLPAEEAIDQWDISRPFTTGNTGNVPRSELLPPNAAPTLRQFLAQYRYIYWLSSNATANPQTSNLSFVANATDRFFESGGKMMIHAPAIPPQNPEDNLGNPALLLLPLDDLLTLPDSLLRLQLPTGGAIQPAEDLPDVAESLPTLASGQFLVTTPPFVVEGSSIIPLYRATYQYRTLDGSSGTWPGASTVASMSDDQRIAYFALPLLNERTGEPIMLDPDDGSDAGRDAVQLMLESLGFPR
jgi:hypothetical protein